MLLCGTIIRYKYQFMLVPRTLLTTMQTLGTCRYFPITLEGRSVTKCGVERASKGQELTHAEFAFPTCFAYFQAPHLHRRWADRLLKIEDIGATEKLSLRHREVLPYFTAFSSHAYFQVVI
jgi:hypothetical protein